MRRLLRLGLLACVVFVNLLTLPHPAGAQAGNEEEAAEAARLISRLEAAGDYDALYDLLHPDAQTVVPRDVVVGWYEDEMAGKTTEELTVTGVEFVTWTWPVTRKFYPDTAEVSFVQSFWEDGEVTEVEDVLRLVESGGEWRWFFGRSREFVDEQLANYAEEPTPTPPPAAPTPREPTPVAGTGNARLTNGGPTCDEFVAHFNWLTPEGATIFSGCWQDASGAWFVLSGTDDPRLPGAPILDPREQEATASLRQALVTQIAGVDAAIAAAGISGDLNGSFDAHGRLNHEGMIRRYSPVFISYVANPNNEALARYADWWVRRRIAAFSSRPLIDPHWLELQARSLGLTAPPVPQQLLDPLTLDQYLDWALANGYVS